MVKPKIIEFPDKYIKHINGKKFMDKEVLENIQKGNMDKAKKIFNSIK